MGTPGVIPGISRPDPGLSLSPRQPFRSALRGEDRDPQGRARAQMRDREL